jgi:zinc and cadmium transporter
MAFMMQGFGLAGAMLASVLVALASLSARLVVWLPPRHLQAWLPWLQAGAAGLLIGDALLHMLPEAMERGISIDQAAGGIALGILGLLAIECTVRAFGASSTTATFARMDIIGDILHHFVDGVVIGAAFAIDHTLGFVVALAIMAHELPREMGNAGVLVAGGYAPPRAFFWSVVTTLAIPLGALLVTLTGHSPWLLGSSLALAAGTTLYLACGDVLPGMWPNLGKRHHFTPILGVTAGMVFMWLAAAMEHRH